MKNKFFIFIVLLISLSSFVMAAPPSGTPNAQSSESGTLTILFPKQDFFFTNKPINLHIHIYNSTGHQKDDEDLLCFLHLYNRTGDHLLQKQLTLDSNGIDWEFTINKTYTKQRGDFPYVIYCNSTADEEVGFITSSFFIRDYDITSDNTESSLPIIIALIGAGALILFFMQTLGEQHFFLKLISVFFFFGTFMLIPAALINGQYATHSPFLKTATYFFRMFIVYFGVYLFWHWAQKSEKLMAFIENVRGKI